MFANDRFSRRLLMLIVVLLWDREDMHMALFRVRDGSISAQVSEIFHEPLGE